MIGVRVVGPVNAKILGYLCRRYFQQIRHQKSLTALLFDCRNLLLYRGIRIAVGLLSSPYRREKKFISLLMKEL